MAADERSAKSTTKTDGTLPGPSKKGYVRIRPLNEVEKSKSKKSDDECVVIKRGGEKQAGGDAAGGIEADIDVENHQDEDFSYDEVRLYTLE